MIDLPAGSWEIVPAATCPVDDKSIVAADHDSAGQFLRQYLSDFMTMSQLRDVLALTDPVFLLDDDSVVDVLAWRLSAGQLVLRKLGQPEEEAAAPLPAESENEPAVEDLPYKGEVARDAKAFAKYMADAARGKTLLQLQAVAGQLTPELRRYWAPQTFTRVVTAAGKFDATVCSVSYHFHTHGQKHGNIRQYTEAARRYFEQNKKKASADAKGIIRLPMGNFDRDGRIITFWG
jgi:hypothetical protein